jgi:hypothetical protein
MKQLCASIDTTGSAILCNTGEAVEDCRRENRLDMRILQARANLCNIPFITRKEERSAIRVRSSALYFVAGF